MTQLGSAPWLAREARINREEALKRLYVQPSPPIPVKGLQDYDDADLVMEMLGRGFVVMPVKDLEDKL